MTTPDITPSDEQNRALLAVRRWLNDPVARRRPFELRGLAGTGKTTIAFLIAREVRGVVKSAAFTGKAASVLRKKGMPGATTIHNLIYTPTGTSNQKERKALEELIDAMMQRDPADRNQLHLSAWRTQLDELNRRSRANFELKAEDKAEICEANLVIIDERSMVDIKMQKDLESFGVPILFLGDPGQLKPVMGAMSDAPADFTLTEIHRQAAESPIIRLAHDLRNGKFPAFGDYGQGVEVLRKSAWDWDRVSRADQVLVGMNATRQRLNVGIRRHRGFTKLFPEAGEKLICLNNNHEEGFLNGVTCMTTAEAIKNGPTVLLEVDWEGERKKFFADAGHFEENYGKRASYPGSGAEIERFDYGYAVTVHKAQGSQWRDVVIADDRMRASDLEHRKSWLYTAVTRAEERLTIYG